MATPQQNGQLSASYSAWRSSRLGQITDDLEHELLFDLLGEVAGKTVLDVGCGDGALACEIARRGAAVTGIEVDAAMIESARRRARRETTRLDLILASAEDLPFDNAVFDRALAVTTLCFVQNPDQAVREMARVLKPGGQLLIGELGRFSLWAAHRRIRGWFGNPVWRTVEFRTAAELRGLLLNYGLEVVTVRGAIHYPPCGVAARLFAPFDLWLGRHTTFGSAFIVLSAKKPERPR